jgi:hypothetical protein
MVLEIKEEFNIPSKKGELVSYHVIDNGTTFNMYAHILDDNVNIYLTLEDFFQVNYSQGEIIMVDFKTISHDIYDDDELFENWIIKEYFTVK